MNFSGFRILPLLLAKFSYFIARLLVVSLWNWTTVKTSFWNCRQQEKSMFTFATPLLHRTYDPRSVIRDEIIVGSGIKHPRSAITVKASKLRLDEKMPFFYIAATLHPRLQLLDSYPYVKKLRFCFVKGTVSRDFLPLGFFTNRLPLGHRWTR
jgi:hypothetical protein